MLSDQAYILHKKVYKDSSELVKCFTKHHGVVDAVAKGSRNPKSKLKGQLQSFIVSQVSLVGKSQLKTIIHSEQTGINQKCPYLNHVSMLYCNELLLLLKLDQEASVAAFPHYEKAIAELKKSEQVSLVLRKFEWHLCGIQGYELTLPDAIADNDYLGFDSTQGLFRDTKSQSCSSQTFNEFLNNKPLTGAQIKEISHLMKKVVNHLVNGKPIQSRMLLQ